MSEKVITWIEDGRLCRGVAVQKLVSGRLPRYVVRPLEGVERTVRVMFVPVSEATVDKWTRRDRGAVIFLDDGVEQLGEVGFLVNSQSTPGKTYMIEPDSENCVCLDRQATGEKCKHAHAVDVWKERNDKAFVDQQCQQVRNVSKELAVPL